MHDDLNEKGPMPIKSVVVTGGNRGIGLDITEAFVNAGYYVVVGARQERGLKERFGDRIVFQEVDVRNESDHEKLVELAMKGTGGLDIYVNNAGFSAWRPIEKIDRAFLDESLPLGCIDQICDGLQGIVTLQLLQPIRANPHASAPVACIIEQLRHSDFTFIISITYPIYL